MIDWVDVKDRLPRIGDTVLVYMDEPIHSTTPYAVSSFDKYGFNRSKVTHWKPLPEKPGSRGLKLLYRGSAKFMKGLKEVDVVRPFYVGSSYVPFGYVINVEGREFIIGTKTILKGKTWTFLI